MKMYEKLGAFYLGKEYDLDNRKLLDDLILYDSKDLVTHAVVVGMTGSGKTGLGVSLLEEAAIDKIPAIVIDPKGDLSNLLLNFPQLKPDDFEPWVNADDANRMGKSKDEFAAEQADLWKNGLDEWGQDGSRVQYLRDSADFNIYTPGSDAGLGVSILSSFAAPPQEVMEDRDLFGDRVSSTATSLLAMVGIDADPVQSREHILLTTILQHVWSKGQNLDLGALIQMVQQPPVTKIGVMDIESFYPAKDRFSLAMAINSLLAAPGFASWMSGEPMDVDRFLYTPEGKPKISIFSISHLSDSERMFFMSLLLNQVLAWMRSRPGTTSLRALLYIDEIFGYMPPVAVPPTKKPLLTLLKQARAFGLGLVLATQNPSDLDYKGLSNTGTWFLGRLQTERDKMRVLDGLEGVTADSGGAFDRDRMSDILSGVGKRVFLMHNVHETEPVVFHTRWALSYLSGPMTRQQIKTLMEDKKELQDATAAPTAPAFSTDVSEAEAPPAVEPPPSDRPVLPPSIPQVFLPMRTAAPKELVYQPMLIGLVKVHFVDTRRGLSADEEMTLLAALETGPLGLDWSEAEELQIFAEDLEGDPEPGCSFGDLPGDATKSKSFTSWKKGLADHLYRSRRYQLFKSDNLKEYSKAGETERDFRIRIADQARELRDEKVESLRKKYASKMNTLEERIRKAELRVQREEQEAKGAKMQSAISFGATVLSAVFGRKIMSGTNVRSAASAARGVGRASKQADDVRRALEDVEAYHEDLEDIENELAEEIEEIDEAYDPMKEELATYNLKPRKTDINIRSLALAWAPMGRGAGGQLVPLYK